MTDGYQASPKIGAFKADEPDIWGEGSLELDSGILDVGSDRPWVSFANTQQGVMRR